MRLNKVFMLIIVLLLPIALLLTTIEIFTFDINYYDKKFEQYEIEEETGLEKSELLEIIQDMLDYLKDKRDSISSKEVFGQREVLHMEDVKVLFDKGFKIRNITLALSILSILFLIIRDKAELGKALIILSSLYLSLMLILASLMYIDFDKYFDYFHMIFFNNDLWLLDPEKDILIQMLPLDFFYSIAYKISSLFIVQLILILFLGIYINRSYKNPYLR